MRTLFKVKVYHLRNGSRNTTHWHPSRQFQFILMAEERKKHCLKRIVDSKHPWKLSMKVQPWLWRGREHEITLLWCCHATLTCIMSTQRIACSITLPDNPERTVYTFLVMTCFIETATSGKAHKAYGWVSPRGDHDAATTVQSSQGYPQYCVTR